MKHSFLYLLVGLFLFACTDSAEQVETPAAGTPVNMNIHLGVAPMQAAEPNAESHAETRAAGDKLADEQKIYKAWLLQFNGTAGTSTLVAAPKLLTLDATGYTDVALQAGNGTHRVYIVANVDATLVGSFTTSTTLTTFEAKVFPCSVMSLATMATKGLPMSAYKDVDMTTGITNQNFELKSRMAKVIFSYTSAASLGAITVTLRNAPDGIICKPDVASNSSTAQRPATGVAYGGTLDISVGPGSPITCYVPENLAGGIAGITKETDRSDEKAAGKSATYITLESGKEENNVFTISTYSIYLGTDLTTSVGDLNVKGNYAYRVSIDVKGNNASADKRVAVSTYNNLSVAADGTPATANCYVVTAAGNYYIDATKQGNHRITPYHPNSGIPGDAVYYDIIPSTLSPISADVLWETVNTRTAPAVGTVVSNASIYKGGRLLFSAGATKGNAVIAVRNASNTILWSWHIWRTEGQPQGIAMPEIADGKGFSVGGLQLMDRTLGALRAVPLVVSKHTAEDGGLVYQWGRKDPFPGTALIEGSMYNTTEKVATTLAGTVKTGGSISTAVAVQNPTTFYTGNTDWTTKNDNLWGTPLTGTAVINNGDADYTYNTNAGSKSIYDPCPIGWKVMPAYGFAKMAGGLNSVEYSLLFPFHSDAENKYYIVGPPALLGSTGAIDSEAASDYKVRSYYWTSSNACKIYAGMSIGGRASVTMTPEDLNRAYGCGVRCVRGE